MKKFINLSSQNIEGATYWSGGVAHLHKIDKNSPVMMATSDSELVLNKQNIIDDIEKRLKNTNFITDEIIHKTTRVGSLEELMELLERVE